MSLIDDLLVRDREHGLPATYNELQAVAAQQRLLEQENARLKKGVEDALAALSA